MKPTDTPTQGHNDYLAKQYAEICKGLAPLCPCDYNPATTDGPQQECPLHGDYTTFVADVQIRERITQAAIAYCEAPDSAQDPEGAAVVPFLYEELCEAVLAFRNGVEDA